MKEKRVFWIVSFVCLVLLTVSFASAAVNESYYNFNDNILDQWNSYDLTAVGGAAYSATFPSFNISGSGSTKSGDYTSGVYAYNPTLLDNSATLGAISISMWVRLDSTFSAASGTSLDIYGKSNVAGDDRIIGRFDSASGTLDFFTEQNAGGIVHTYTTQNSWTGGNWYHIVFTWGANGGKKMYINATNDGTDGAETTVMADGTDTHFYVGSWNGATPFEGLIDEFKVYGKELNQTEVTNLFNYGNIAGAPPPPANATYYQLSLFDLYNNTKVSGVNITFAPGCWNLTDAGGFARVTNETCAVTGTLTNVTIAVPTNYTANATSYTIPENSSVDAGIYQKIISVNATSLVTNSSVSTPFTIISSGGRSYNNGTNIYAIKGTHNYSFTKTGWYPVTQEIEIKDVGSAYTLTGAYNNKYNFTATNIVTAAPINTFTIIANNTANSYSVNISTTNGTAIVPTEQGLNYTYIINASGFAYDNITLESNATWQTHAFQLYVTNTFIIDIYDETNNTQITNHNFTLQFISDAFSTNTTYNGTTHYEELLVPGDYEIRYFEEGTNATYRIKKSYFVTLTNKSYQQIKLYSIPFSISGYYTPILLTSSGYYAQGVIIKAYRGYIQNDTLVGTVVEMSKTDPNGQAVFRIEPNNVFYKFSGQDGNDRFETNYFKITQETHTFQLLEGTLLGGIAVANAEPYNLTFITGTNSFRLTWDDSTNSIKSGCMIINKYDETGETTVSNTCSTGSSGSIAYMATDTNETTFLATAKLITTTATITDSLTHSYRQTYQIWGLIGVFLTLIVFLFAVAMGATAEGVVINGSLAILLMSMIGIFAIEWSAIVGILIVAGIIVYKTKS